MQEWVRKNQQSSSPKQQSESSGKVNMEPVFPYFSAKMLWRLHINNHLLSTFVQQE